MADVKTLFIINPISGGTKKGSIDEMLREHLDSDIFGEPEVAVSEYAGHAPLLAAQAIENEYTTVIIAGGDGTINEVGSKLAGTKVRLGIIPGGSGNGLARHLKIPLTPLGAIHNLNKNKVLAIDAGRVNNKYFFCTSGVGFDAWIGYLFSTSKKRGFWTYVTTTIKEFYRYRAEDYEIIIDNKSLKEKAFLVTVANAAQYGNEAVIAPAASVEDGKLDLCILSPFPLYRAAEIGMRLFNKSINKSVYLTTMQATEIIIKRKEAGVIHLDGEPLQTEEELHYSIIPSQLNILVP